MRRPRPEHESHVGNQGDIPSVEWRVEEGDIPDMSHCNCNFEYELYLAFFDKAGPAARAAASAACGKTAFGASRKRGAAGSTSPRSALGWPCTMAEMRDGHPVRGSLFELLDSLVTTKCRILVRHRYGVNSNCFSRSHAEPMYLPTMPHVLYFFLYGCIRPSNLVPIG